MKTRFKRRPARHPLARRTRSVGLEHLEDRRLLALTAFLNCTNENRFDKQCLPIVSDVETKLWSLDEDQANPIGMLKDKHTWNMTELGKEAEARPGVSGLCTPENCSASIRDPNSGDYYYDSAKKHLQSIQYIDDADNRYIVTSLSDESYKLVGIGSDQHPVYSDEAAIQLIKTVQFGSEKGANDYIVEQKLLNDFPTVADFNHPGGSQLIGNYLFLALEDFEKDIAGNYGEPKTGVFKVDPGADEKIQFQYLVETNPDWGGQVGQDVAKGDRHQSTVAVTKLADETYLMAACVFDECEHINFYKSKGTTLDTNPNFDFLGQWNHSERWVLDEQGKPSTDLDENWSDCGPQNMNLIAQDDGSIYLAMFGGETVQGIASCKTLIGFDDHMYVYKLTTGDYVWPSSLEVGRDYVNLDQDDTWAPDDNSSYDFQSLATTTNGSGVGLTVNVEIGGDANHPVAAVDIQDHGSGYQTDDEVHIAGALLGSSDEVTFIFKEENFGVNLQWVGRDVDGNGTLNEGVDVIPNDYKCGGLIKLGPTKEFHALNLLAGSGLWPSPDGNGDIALLATEHYDSCGSTVSNGKSRWAVSGNWNASPPAVPPDEFEENDTPATATVLGSIPELTFRDLTLHESTDVDYFQITAPVTGQLLINAHFAHDDGNIDLQIFGGILVDGDIPDEDNTLIASSQTGTDDEQIVIPVVAQQRYYVYIFSPEGHTNWYDLEIETYPAPVPGSVKLNPSDDTGRSNSDNLTNLAESRIFVEADLTEFAAAGIAILDATEVANNESGAAVEVFVNGTHVGYADPIPGTNNTLFAFTFDAGDLSTSFSPVGGGGGLNFVDAAVRVFDGQKDIEGNPAPATGRTQMSEPLLLTLDVVAPSVSFIGIDPASTDTGVDRYPTTVIDRVTSDTTTGFVGQTEADAIVRMWADGPDVSPQVLDASDTFQGYTVALPENGNPQVATGQWNLTGQHDLNDPNFFPLDGVRQIGVTAEDLAGNVGEAAFLEIFIDTQGPQITDVFITSDPTANLFTPKPMEGPTLRLEQLSITVADFPARSSADPNFLYDALLEEVAEHPGHYSIEGDRSGLIAINNIDFIPDPPSDGHPATGTLVFTFFDPLPDDRFTVVVSADVVDPVGNALDGESNAIQPIDPLSFPSGDGLPGGSFRARFTVDSRPEIGVTASTRVYVDINGDYQFNPAGTGDITNRDLIFQLGTVSDAYFVGDFSAAGAVVSSEFDKLGAYGWDPFAQKYRFLLDLNHNGVADFSSYTNVTSNGLPVAGDFDPNHPGDEIGLFDGNKWYLDNNGDNVLNVGSDTSIATSMHGIPIVGDVNGDGADDLITYDSGSDTFYIDLNRDGTVDDTIKFGIPDFVERPVAGDLNQDGVDDLGLWVAGSADKIGEGKAEWYFLLSDRIGTGQGTAASVLFDPYSPDPLGNDLFAIFGDRHSLPLFGNFDPPVIGNDGSSSTGWQLSYHNLELPLDVSGDGTVSPIDALLVIHQLNSSGSTGVPDLLVEYTVPAPYPDVNSDRFVSPIDALLVINYLNSNFAGEGEGEGLLTRPAILATPANMAATVTWKLHRDAAIEELDAADEQGLNVNPSAQASLGSATPLWSVLPGESPAVRDPEVDHETKDDVDLEDILDELAHDLVDL